MLIVAVAGVASCAPLLSIAAYWKLGAPLKLAAGVKYSVAALPDAVINWFNATGFSPAASVDSVPFVGRLVIANDATVPSMSLPDSTIAIAPPSSAPDAEVSAVVGAWLTVPIVTVAVALARMFTTPPSSIWNAKLRSVVIGVTLVLLNCTNCSAAW